LRAPARASSSERSGLLERNEFDVVLVVEYFRSITAYFSIVRHLTQSHRVGIYCVPLDKTTQDKNVLSQKQFVELCKQWGASDVTGTQVSCRLLLVPQRPFTDEAVLKLKADVRYRRAIGLLAFAWAGTPIHDNFLQVFGIKKVCAIDAKFLSWLLDKRKSRAYCDLEIVEVGLPYKKYPVFEDFSADYLLAMPTPFSFPHETDKWHFLETVLKLFAQLHPRDVVVHKAHNGMDRDQFSPVRYRVALRCLGPLRRLISTFARRFAARLASGRLKRALGNLYTAFLYECVLQRTTSMEKLTPYHHFSMEAFLPKVRKGVIGGLSNTIWGALYFQLPFYNCVDIDRQRRSEVKDRLYGKKDPGNFLDLNLQYFLIPYCRGQLSFDPSYFALATEGARRGDIIAVIRQELA
jgi:hypothetical protein